MLKLKQSELRLYCDLLSQQTHELKNLVNTTYTPNFKNSESTTTVVETGIEILNNPQNSPMETLNSAASSFKSAENNSSENFSSEQNTSESDTIKVTKKKQHLNIQFLNSIIKPITNTDRKWMTSHQV